MNKTAADLRQELIESYNHLWDDFKPQDNTGLVQACKADFQKKLDLLIETLKDEEDPVY